MEEDYPRTLLELERRFSTEHACRGICSTFAGRMYPIVLVVQ